MPAVTYTITAKQTVTGPAKDAQKSLESLGKQAAESGAKLEAMAKAVISFELIKKGVELTAKAFQTMAEHSNAMAGELKALDGSFGRMAKSIGDSLANSAAFKLTIDAVSGALAGMDQWIRENSKTVGVVLKATVDGAVWAVRGLAFSIRGLDEYAILLSSIVVGAWQTAVQAIEVSVIAIELAYDKLDRLTNPKTSDTQLSKGQRAQRNAVSEDISRRLKEALAGPNIVDAFKQTEKLIIDADKRWDDIDKKLADFQAKVATGIQTRKTKWASLPGSKPPEQPAKPHDADYQPFGGMDLGLSLGGKDAGTSYATGEKEQDRLRRLMGLGTDAEMQKIRNDYNKTQLEFYKQQEELQRQHDETMEEMSKQSLFNLKSFQEEMSDTIKAAYSSLAEGLGQSIAAAIQDGASFGDMMKKMAADVAFGVAIQATVKAAYEVAEGIAMLAGIYTAPLAAGHFAAAAKYAIAAGIGYGVGAVASGAGSGSSHGGGAPSASQGISASDNQRLPESGGTSGQKVYQITNVFNGTYTTEKAAGRSMLDAIGAANRGGTAATSAVRRFRANA